MIFVWSNFFSYVETNIFHYISQWKSINIHFVLNKSDKNVFFLQKSFTPPIRIKWQLSNSTRTFFSVHTYWMAWAVEDLNCPKWWTCLTVHTCLSVAASWVTLVASCSLLSSSVLKQEHSNDVWRLFIICHPETETHDTKWPPRTLKACQCNWWSISSKILLKYINQSILRYIYLDWLIINHLKNENHNARWPLVIW